MNEDRRILVVDDDEGARTVLSEMIRDLGYEAGTAADGFEALAQLKLGFGLVLLDARMPGMDGFEVLRKLRRAREHSDVPIIMVTALDSIEDQRRALEAGADDFIAKPVARIVLQVRVDSLLRRKAAEDALEAERNELEKKLERQTADLQESVRELTETHRATYRSQVETLERLATACEYRDESTGNHVRRIRECCALLGERLNLPPGDIEVLSYASPMHDVGKIGVPDGILLKRAKLDRRQWEIMKTHSAIGARILGGSSSRYLQAGEIIALTHHERWDGTGYPGGLKGEDIPLFGRITAVADVFDALTCKRPYRDALALDEALEVMKKRIGTHFDPRVVGLFVEDFDEVCRIREKFPNCAPRS